MVKVILTNKRYTEIPDPHPLARSLREVPGDDEPRPIAIPTITVELDAGETRSVELRTGEVVQVRRTKEVFY